MPNILTELRFRSSRTARFYCRFEGEGDDITKADIRQVISMLELILETCDEPEQPNLAPAQPPPAEPAEPGGE